MQIDPTTLGYITVVSVILGPLVGAGAGSYFGIKHSLNGLKRQTGRVESVVSETRDYARDTVRELDRVERQVDEIHAEVTK